MRNDRNQRAAILNAALIRFAQCGYAGTSTRDLVEDLGIGRSAIYHHFPSKEQILYEIMSTGMRSMLDGLAELMTSLADEPADVRLAAAIRYTTMSNIAHLDHRHLYDSEVRSLTTEHQAAFRSMKVRYDQYFHDMVTEGVDAGLWPPTNVRLYVADLLVVCRCHWYNPAGPNTPDEIADFNAAFARQALAHGRAPSGNHALQRSAASTHAT